MKKLLPLLALAMLLQTGASAQFSLGVDAGANLSKIDGTSFNTAFKVGYLLGAYTQLKFSKHWGVEVQALFIQSQTQTDSSFDAIYKNVLSNPVGLKNINLDYLGIPCLLTYRILGLIDLEAGPQFGIMLNSQNSLLQNGQDAFKRGDVTLLAGAEVHILMLRVFARYGWGLGNVNNISTSEVSDADTWKNRSIQLGVGIKIL